MPVNDEVLNVGIELDIRQALRQAKKFQQGMTKVMRDVGKVVGKAAKANAKMAQDSAKDTKDQIDQFHDLEDAIGDAMKAGKSKKGFFHVDSKKLAKEAGAGLKTAAEGFTGMVSRDLKGIIQNSAKALRGTLGTAIKGVAAGGMKVGKGLHGAGAGLGARGRTRGGWVGMGMRAGGAGLRAGGKAIGGMGKLVGIVSKVGPLLSAAVTAVVKLVTMFIDAEAQVKKFQQEILQTASTVEFLGSNSWDTNRAFGALSYTIKEIRAAAFDLEANWAMGLSAEDYKSVLNALNQSGVSLQRIGREADISKKPVKEFVSELVHVSVAYSRAFGQPISEISQLQAEMMTDMGMSVEETKVAFGQMARAASESGIAANKFFSIIRGASQDMSLYNLRMGDAVKTLKMLGKVMNPRNAQKFFSTAMQGMKNMGRQELLQGTLLAGEGKTRAIVTRDLDQKYKLLAKKLNMDAQKVQDIIATEGVEGLAFQINSLPEEMQGAVREMAIETEIQATRAKKGTYGLATAAQGLGIGGSLEMQEAMLTRFGGTGDIRKDVGEIGIGAMAEKLGKSIEEVNNLIKAKAGFEMQRKMMKGLLEKQAEGKVLTPEEKEKLKAIEAAGLDANNIAQAGYQQLLEGMSESDRESLESTNKVVDHAAKQTNLQTSLVDRLDRIINFLMDQLYNVILDLWGGFLKLLQSPMLKLGNILGGGDWLEAQEMKLAAIRGGGAGGAGVQEIGAALENASDDIHQFSTELLKTRLGKEFNESLLVNTETLGKHEAYMKRLNSVYSDMTTEAGPKQFDPEQIAMEYFGQSLEAIGGEKKLREKLGKLNEAVTAEVVGKGERSKAAKGALERSLKGGDREEALARGVAKAFGGKLTAEGGVSGLSEDAQKRFDNAMASIESGQGFVSTVEREFGADASRKILGEAAFYGGQDPTAVSKMAREYSEETEYDKRMEDIQSRQATASEKLLEEGTKGSTLYFKFPNGFLTGDYQNAVEDAVLSAVRKALFEYYLYSGMGREDLIKKMKERGATPESMAKEAYNQAKRGKFFADKWGKQAEGGGIMGRIRHHVKKQEAKAEAAKAGGGGVCKVEISLKPDAAKIFKATIIDTMYEANRKGATS